MSVAHTLARLRFGNRVRQRSSDHVHSEDLERFALNKVGDVERAKIAAHVYDCEVCRSGLEEAQQFAFQLAKTAGRSVLSSGHERCKEQRLGVTEAAQVKILQPPEFTAVECEATDVSSSGLRLRVPRAIFRGTSVEVKVEGAAIFGTVRHCQRNNEDGFDVGLEIDQVEWSVAEVGAQFAAAAAREQHRTADSTIEVLLVEDNAADVRLTRMVLEELAVPCHVTVANDGVEAINHLLDSKQRKPNLVLLDLNLPKMGGLEMLERVRSEDAIHSIAIAVLSSSASASDVRRSKELGVCAYFQKPVDYDLWVQMGHEIRTLVFQQAAAQ